MSNTLLNLPRRGSGCVVLVLATALVVSLCYSSVGLCQTPFFPFTEDFAGPFDDDDPVTWQGIDMIDYLGNVVTTQLDLVADGVALSNPAQIDPTPESGFSLGGAYVYKNGEEWSTDQIGYTTTSDFLEIGRSGTR